MTIKMRQTFFSHAMRREAVENIVITEKMTGKRGRGKMSEMMLCGLRWLHEGTSIEFI